MWQIHSQTPDSVKYDDKTNVTGDGKLRIFFFLFEKRNSIEISNFYYEEHTHNSFSILLHLELLGIFNFYIKFQINYRFRSWICVKHACSGKYDKAEYPPPAEIDIKALNVITTEMSSLVDFIF
jgi:hypothetical protein